METGIFENSPNDLTEAQGQWSVIFLAPTAPKWQIRDLNIQLFSLEIFALFLFKKKKNSFNLSLFFILRKRENGEEGKRETERES